MPYVHTFNNCRDVQSLCVNKSFDDAGQVSTSSLHWWCEHALVEAS